MWLKCHKHWISCLSCCQLEDWFCGQIFLQFVNCNCIVVSQISLMSRVGTRNMSFKKTKHEACYLESDRDTINATRESWKTLRMYQDHDIQNISHFIFSSFSRRCRPPPWCWARSQTSRHSRTSLMPHSQPPRAPTTSPCPPWTNTPTSLTRSSSSSPTL